MALHLETKNAFLNYQKTATKSFFLDLMTQLENYNLKDIQLQYCPDTSPNSFNLVSGAYLLEEVMPEGINEDIFDFNFGGILVAYEKHLPQIMGYVYEKQGIKPNQMHEFELDIENFSDSALNFCGKELIEEVEKYHLESRIKNTNSSKKLKV